MSRWSVDLWFAQLSLSKPTFWFPDSVAHFACVTTATFVVCPWMHCMALVWVHLTRWCLRREQSHLHVCAWVCHGCWPPRPQRVIQACSVLNDPHQEGHINEQHQSFPSGHDKIKTNIPGWEGMVKGKFLVSKDEFLQKASSLQRKFFLWMLLSWWENSVMGHIMTSSFQGSQWVGLQVQANGSLTSQWVFQCFLTDLVAQSQSLTKPVHSMIGRFKVWVHLLGPHLRCEQSHGHVCMRVHLRCWPLPHVSSNLPRGQRRAPELQLPRSEHRKINNASKFTQVGVGVQGERKISTEQRLVGSLWLMEQLADWLAS